MLPTTLLIPGLFAVAGLAQPARIEARAAAPSVTIKNGTVVGSTSSNVDAFLGIPFAQPPVGPLRLKPPQSINTTFGTLDATKSPAVCPQMIISDKQTLDGLPTEVLGFLLDTPFFETPLNESEDCLTINIYRPSNATSSSKLPVVFWIFGGGFELGGTELPSYNGSPLVQRSTSLGADMIFVAVNYRVAGFGFLAGKELQKDGSTNLGLRDQRLGLEWISENIAAFGGDPDRVTIWGESAGSISVFDQLIINNGDNTYNGKALFHGAIMNSGSAVPALDVSSEKAQLVYDTVVDAAGCSTASDSLACLRSVSYNTFQNAVNSLPSLISYQSLDLAYLPRPDPSNNFFPFAPNTSTAMTINPNIPIIIGDQEDEGTIFALSENNLTTTQDVINYIASYFPEAPESIIAGLVATYPDNPSAGAPFGTGLLNEIYPQYKRLAAILGDITFVLTRRAVLAAYSYGNPNVQTWTYLSTWFDDLPIVGTFHASDLLEIYFDGTPFPNPRDTFYNKYISFINYQNPNHFDAVTGQINWPQWDNTTLSMLQIGATSNKIITDNFREASYNYLVANENYFHV